MRIKYFIVNISNIYFYYRYILIELYDYDGILNFMIMYVMMFEFDDEWWFKR